MADTAPVINIPQTAYQPQSAPVIPPQMGPQTTDAPDMGQSNPNSTFDMSALAGQDQPQRPVRQPAPPQRPLAPHEKVAQAALAALGGSDGKPGSWAKAILAGGLAGIAGGIEGMGAAGAAGAQNGVNVGAPISAGVGFEQAAAQKKAQQGFENQLQQSQDQRAQQEADDRHLVSVASLKHYEQQMAMDSYNFSRQKLETTQQQQQAYDAQVAEAKSANRRVLELPQNTDIHKLSNPDYLKSIGLPDDVIHQYVQGNYKLVQRIADVDGKPTLQGTTLIEQPGPEYLKSRVSEQTPILTGSPYVTPAKGDQPMTYNVYQLDPNNPAKAPVVSGRIPINSIGVGADLDRLNQQNEKVMTDHAKAIQEERNNAAIRDAAKAPYETYAVYNSKTGKVELHTGGELQDPNNRSVFTQPRKVGAKDIESWRHDTTILNDVQNKMNNVTDSLGALNQDAVQQGIIAKALSDPKADTVDQLVQAGVLKGASDTTMHYVQSVLSFREAAMGLQKLRTGSARTSEPQIKAMLATQPGVAPSANWAANQLKQFQQDVTTLHEGIPEIAGVQNVGPKAAAPTAPDNAIGQKQIAPGVVIYQLQNGSVVNAQGQTVDPQTGKPMSQTDNR